MTVSYSLELPTQRVEEASEFVNAEAIAEIARAAESSGFAAVHVTDHPAPDAKWLDHGGHHALDPFVALSFAAAATTDVKLLTNVYIAAYRNPLPGREVDTKPRRPVRRPPHPRHGRRLSETGVQSARNRFRRPRCAAGRGARRPEPGDDR
ncbi:LLM class flavin-dependent oxidoreductase [Mycolicibacterium novocastrense]|nr:LLM class flavin-dependent oxidoreductase [Mycolicibacterium novocastrense]